MGCYESCMIGVPINFLFLLMVYVMKDLCVNLMRTCVSLISYIKELRYYIYEIATQHAVNWQLQRVNEDLKYQLCTLIIVKSSPSPHTHIKEDSLFWNLNSKWTTIFWLKTCSEHYVLFLCKTIPCQQWLRKISILVLFYKLSEIELQKCYGQ